MLRPQVFALYENLTPASGEPVQIGLIASERQAINACLRSLAEEDARFQPHPDLTWVARGGSHTDGGAFRFCVTADGLACYNKFGQAVTVAADREHVDRANLRPERAAPGFRKAWTAPTVPLMTAARPRCSTPAPCYPLPAGMSLPGRSMNWPGSGSTAMRSGPSRVVLTRLRDTLRPRGEKAGLIPHTDRLALARLFGAVPGLDAVPGSLRWCGIAASCRTTLRPPLDEEATLVVDTLGPPEATTAPHASSPTRLRSAAYRRI